MNICACGCGELCNKTYLHGHNNLSKFKKFIKGNKPWNIGLSKEDPRILKSINTVKLTYASGKHKNLSKEVKNKRSESQKRTFREHPEIIQKMCSCDNTRSNSFENKLIEVITRNKLPFRWVGNGKFWLTYQGKNINPDFIAEKPNNVVIEVFCNHFKIENFGSIKNYMKYRKKAFNYHKFKVIFFNDNILKYDDHKIINKLNRFIYA